MRPVCPYCGELEHVDLFEVWGDREFMFETCCGELHDEITDAIADEPELAGRMIAGLGYGSALRGRLRRTVERDCQVVIDYALEVRPVTLAQARAFIAEHHAHNAPPVGWRFGAGAFNGSELVAVVVVGRPVARMIDGTTTVEVTRLCTRRGDPLAWNACSQLYGWAAREAKARGFARVITYTLETEQGTTLRAAGWQREAMTRGGSWTRPSRARVDTAPTCRKVRWSRTLRQQAAARVPA